MTTPSVQPDSPLRRNVELDAVRDVILLQPEVRRTTPLPRTTGVHAIRGTLEGQLRGCIAAYDLNGERDCSLSLAKMHFDRGLDLDRGVQLLHRALEIQDHRELRNELVRQLVMMGRHLEAGHVMRDGELPQSTGAVEQWLAAGDAYARAADFEETLATFREAALLAPDDPRPFERIAATGYWLPQILPPERSADALLEAAKRYPPGSATHILSLTRACEMAPGYARGAQALVSVLRYQGRPRVAAELWRDYARASNHQVEVAHQLLIQAQKSGDVIAALFAALDSCWSPGGDDSKRFEPLQSLLQDDNTKARLEDDATTDEPFSVALFTSALLAATRTRSTMARADGFMKLSQRMRGELRALLLVYAAEGYAAAGNKERAAAAASMACEGCSWLPRAHATITAVAVEPVPARSLEMALAKLPAKAQYCEAMASQYQALDNAAMSLAWTRRTIMLRPGDSWPLEMLLQRANASGDPTLIADAIALAIQVPCPCNPLSQMLASSLNALLELDVEKAAKMARLVVGTSGPGLTPLYDTLRNLAAHTKDQEWEALLAARRAVGDDVGDDERANLYLEAAELCRQQQALEVACEHLCCAAAHAGPLDRLEPLLQQLSEDLEELHDDSKGDAMLALAHARAWTAEQQDTRSAVQAWRQLGALRWDLADDALRAEEAYFIACAQDPEAGPYQYARDLADRAGPAGAVNAVLERAVALLAEDGADRRLGAKLYAAAAHVAAENDLTEIALNAAVAAVQTDASRADAVALVEKIATGEEGLAALIKVYNTLADAALGRFGYRAAHYRAARQLEQRDALEQALQHAILAFEAVPSLGACYQLLLRLASRTGDAGAAIRTLAGVASAYPPEGQSLWLLRAAELAKQEPKCVELRFDVLLKVFRLQPGREVLAELGECATELCEATQDHELVRRRLQRAINAAVPDLKGPRTAPIAVAMAAFAIEHLDEADLASELLMRAVALDRRHTDYTAMLPHVDALLAHPEAARRLLDNLDEFQALSSGPFDNALRTLASRLHGRLSDSPPETDPPMSSLPPTEPAAASPPETEAPSIDAGATDPEVQTSATGMTEDELLDSFERDGPGTLPSMAAIRLAEPTAPAPSTPPGPASTPTSSERPSFDPASERQARARGDHDAIADMLAARAASTSNVEQRRLIRLRRAAVLEQRLQRLTDAQAELEILLAENRDDITALRYLADLCDRSDEPARAARLWLNASRLAQSLDEKLRDVIRCCDSLLNAGKPNIAQRLIDAARELPQSLELLDTRLRVAQALSSVRDIKAAQHALAALEADHTDGDVVSAAGEASSPAALSEPGPQSAADVAEAPASTASTDAPPASAGPRKVFRVRSPAVRPEGEASDLLEECRRRLFRWSAEPGCASDDVQLLNLLRPELKRPDYDLHTYLLVEALDASGDRSSAIHELQEHWEHFGATPLVTLAVGDRLLRRRAYEQALRMYRRLFDAELRGIRSHGQVALDSADAATRLGDEELAEQLLERAARDDDTHEEACELLAALPGRTTLRPPADQTTAQTASDPHAETPAEQKEKRKALPPLRPPLPSLPQSESAGEERLLNELRAGSFDAGETLIQLLRHSGRERSREVLQVRRNQIVLRPGDLDVLAKLKQAAKDDHSQSYARAVDHVIAAFDAERTTLSPPPLADVPAQPEATARMLFCDMHNTINEAFAILCEAGVMRRDLTSYDFTGTDRVPPGATTAVSRVYAQLARLIDLGGVRLFHRARQRERLSFGVALLSPLAAIFSGRADVESAELHYTLACALAAATPSLAMIEALDENAAQNVIAALRTGFGQVGDGSVAGASIQQIRLAEDMWHMVSGAADRRLREIAADSDKLHYSLALRHAQRAQRRAGLFAAGDILVAMKHLIEDVGIDIKAPLRSAAALQQLGEIPEAKDLLLLALSPQYAQSRWLVS